MVKDELNFEKLRRLWVTECADLVSLWKKSLQQSDGIFEAAFESCIYEIIHDKSRLLKDLDRFAWRGICLGRVVDSWIIEQVGSSPTRFVRDSRQNFMTSRLGWAYEHLYGPEGRDIRDDMLEFVHARKTLSMFGDKVYQVSSGLQWQLENTHLTKYPASGLRLPYPAIYILHPKNKYRVYVEDETYKERRIYCRR